MQGDPCEVCPVVNTDGAKVISMPGAKGQRGSPGIGEPGQAVSNEFRLNNPDNFIATHRFLKKHHASVSYFFLSAGTSR